MRQVLIFIIILSLFFIIACEESKVACLDFQAENYDVAAVFACDDCCDFPEVKLKIDFDYDTLETFVFDRFYPLGESDSISVQSIQIAFSEFSFVDDATLHILDTVSFVSPRLYDDFLIIERSRTEQVIGSTAYAGTVTSFACRVGLPLERLDPISPYENVDEASQLSAILEKLYVDSIPELFQARMNFVLNDSLRMIELTEISEPMISFPDSIVLIAGESWRIDLALDIALLFKDIRPLDSDVVLSQTLSNNLSAALFKKE